MQARSIHIKTRALSPSNWNSGLLVNQLPNEIFVPIIIESNWGLGLATSDYSRYAPLAHEVRCHGRLTWLPLSGPFRNEWRYLMLVCRHWRDVLLATPMLWRHIDVGSEAAWLQHALTHSSPALLEISFNHSEASKEQIALLKAHLHRTRRVCFSLTPSAVSIFSPSDNISYPALEALEIRQVHSYYLLGNLHINTRRFPRLQELSLVQTTSTLLPTFKHLRKLRLVHCTYRRSLQHFVQLLIDSPRLEHLELCHFLHQFKQDEPPGYVSGHPTLLPSIRFLGLSCLPQNVLRFFSYIRLPPTASLHMTAYITSVEFVSCDLSLTKHFIPSNVCALLPGLASVTHATLSVDSGNSYLCGSSTQQNQPDVLRMRLFICDEDGIEIHHWFHAKHIDMRETLAVFGRSPLAHITINGKWIYSENLFSSFPTLESLRATFTLLLLPSKETFADTCANIQCLVLELGFYAEDQNCDRHFEILIDLLRHRAGQGNRMRELQFLINNSTTLAKLEHNDYLSQLQEVVDEVTVLELPERMCYSRRQFYPYL